MVQTAFLMVCSLAVAERKNDGTKTVAVNVDLGKVEHRMAGGIGASWHAIRKQLPGHRGSAWGANPPLEYEKAWRQIYQHASWLGLD